MAKLTNVRERVHQPFRDTLIRTSGFYANSVQDRTDLFTQAGKDDGQSNLKNGSTLPSDQSMVVLALRVFTWFRQSIRRLDIRGDVYANGDYLPSAATDPGSTALNGSAVGDVYDVYRLNWQAEEQLLWSFGSGEKFSLSSMPTAYFPYGGGLSGDMGAVACPPKAEDVLVAEPIVLQAAPVPEIRCDSLIHWQNGTPDHAGILRLARAVLLPPRQNVKCQAQIVRLPDGGNGSIFQSSQASRDMLSLTANLNAVDLINKVISFTFDGLFSRDVQ